MTNIQYQMQGDYRLPNLKMPAQPETELGVYAQMRRQYLKQNHKPLYIDLMTQAKLTEHLAETQQRAQAMEESLVRQMAAQEQVTEQLKASDMMTWVAKMNSIRNRAREIVLSEIIYN